MFDNLARQSIEAFTPAAQRDAAVRDAGGEVIGHSEAGRPICGTVIGDGPRRVSLVAGAHSDEPVGAETLRLLCERRSDAATQRRWGEFTLVIVPHVNPDGEAKQRAWLEAWPDPLAYLTHRLREAPGRDVEFAYPEGRPENAVVSAFLADHGPFDLHLSLHGMAVATGGWHLIERSWADRTAELRQRYAKAMRDAGLERFDWDRGGDKGFDYLGPGFATTPRSDAMREHFLRMGDDETAAKFGLNSMEYVRTLGNDPLCMVTELPLWVIQAAGIEDEPGDPRRYFAFGDAVGAAREAMGHDDTAAALRAMQGFTMQPLSIATAVGLQLRAIELGLEAVGAWE